MPGFFKEHGGPRTKGQIDSLVTFLNDKPVPDPSNTVGKLVGRKLYAERCSACHGSLQLGGIGPNLQESKKNYTTDALSKLLKEGTDHLMMPSFLKEKGGSMDEDQIEAVSNYLISGEP